MKYVRLAFVICFSIFIYPVTYAQITDAVIAAKYPFIHTILNRLSRENNLDAVYEKLYTLKTSGKGKITIVHIGDSHIQAGPLTAAMRNNLQNMFGNAGRGLIFPYQLANKNAPTDIKAFSNARWKYNSVLHPESPIKAGIAGYVIQTTSIAPVINVKINDGGDRTFNKLVFYFDSTQNISWVLHIPNNNLSTIIHAQSFAATVNVNSNINSFSLSALPSSATKTFYGVSLEKDSTGILYHSIGVNGATYNEYNLSPLFWEQLPALHADMYIVSMGTNEAVIGGFTDDKFINSVNQFIENLKRVSPNASIIITSPPDSYKNGKPNTLIRSISNDLNTCCTDNKTCFWNMYNITNGSGSVAQWKRYGMLQADGVHYSTDGYTLQGSLLYNAFMHGYNNYEALKKK